MFHLNMPAAPFQMVTQSNAAAAFMVPPPHDEPAIKAALGPLGFLAIGATVAVSCYLLVHNFLIK